jgi:hypothetical protein
MKIGRKVVRNPFGAIAVRSAKRRRHSGTLGLVRPGKLRVLSPTYSNREQCGRGYAGHHGGVADAGGGPSPSTSTRTHHRLLETAQSGLRQRVKARRYFSEVPKFVAHHAFRQVDQQLRRRFLETSNQIAGAQVE